MSTNPNPARITEPMWSFWLRFNALEPPVELGGIYADKSGYHNTRLANQLRWPGNYSVRHAMDLAGPNDKAAAIDLTFPDARRGDYRTIDKYSSRLLKAGQDRDPRTRFLREFYGNADSDSEVEGWDFLYHRPATSDSSHLWHIHISILRMYADSTLAFDALFSILAGTNLPVPSPSPGSIDMPLDANDIQKVTAAVVAELLKWENLKKLGQAVWDVDYVEVRPGTDNPTWQAKTVLANAMLAAERPIDIDALATALVGKLPPNTTQDMEAIRSALRQVLRDGVA